MSDQGPTVFNGRYELLRHIARGGMADVYLARDELLDREVALKVLFPEFANDPNFVERFRREAQAAANLNHPNIVGIYDWGQERGTYYIVMEHVAGRSMSDVLRSTGPLQPDRAAEIAADVAAALSVAHRAGLVHRDVKLGNILVSDSGAVKVADFGIATALAGGVDSGLTQHGSVMGTATYFSPEQAQGKQVDGRSDLYSLGVVLYEMLAGTPPFQAESPVAVAYKHVQEKPQTLIERGVPVAKSLNAITMKLLAKNPSNRYPTADDLRNDLQRYLSGAHQVPGAAAAAGAAAAGVAATTAAAAPAVDATTVVPTTPAATPAVGASSASGPAGAAMDPTSLGTAYPADGYYYDDGEEEPAGDDWRRTVALLIGLGVLIFILGFLTIAFGRQLGLFGDDNDSDDPVVDKVEVPVLEGLDVAEAEAALRDLGLKPVVTEKPNANFEAGIVFDQLPPPGQKLDPGSEVELIVSTGKKIVVPAVISMTEADAIRTLAEAGYTADPQEEFSELEVGTVISQTPIAGTEHPLDQPVIIKVSSGPETVPLPDLRGQTVDEAFKALQELGLVIANATVPEASDSVERGAVTRTDPAAGSIVDVGSEITIFVSSGVEQVLVPSVVTLLYDVAELTLRNQGLEPVVQFRPVPFGDPQVGVVIEQSPGGNASVNKGSEVVIVVGQGEEPPNTTAPDA